MMAPSREQDGEPGPSRRPRDYRACGLWVRSSIVLPFTPVPVPPAGEPDVTVRIGDVPETPPAPADGGDEALRRFPNSGFCSGNDFKGKGLSTARQRQGHEVGVDGPRHPFRHRQLALRGGPFIPKTPGRIAHRRQDRTFGQSRLRGSG